MSLLISTMYVKFMMETGGVKEFDNAVAVNRRDDGGFDVRHRPSRSSDIYTTSIPWEYRLVEMSEDN